MRRPLGVRIIASLMLLSAILTIFGLVIVLIFARSDGTSNVPVATVMLFSAAIFAVPAYGLLKLKNWGRLLSIVLCGLIVLAGAAQILTQVQTGAPALKQQMDVETFFFVNLALVAVSAWALWYLSRSEIKQVFQTVVKA
jgi:hypothetical protein